jgi:serine/threonine-protein kinase HipA
MTMLGKYDGAGAEDGTSYLELVEFLQTYGARGQEDLSQLWRRIVSSFFLSGSLTQ